MSEATATRDERLHKATWLTQLLRRPELGAVAGTILIIAFFAATAGGSGLFSAKGIVTFLEVSAQLGILAVAVSLLMTVTSRKGVLVPNVASKGPVVFRPWSAMVEVPVAATLVNVAPGRPLMVMPLVIVSMAGSG